MKSFKKATKLLMKNASTSFLALFIFELHPEKKPLKKKKKEQPLEVGAVGERVSHFATAGTTGYQFPSRTKTLTAPLKTLPEAPQQLLKLRLRSSGKQMACCLAQTACPPERGSPASKATGGIR